jgi:hypothetical protein
MINNMKPIDIAKICEFCASVRFDENENLVFGYVCEYNDEAEKHDCAEPCTQDDFAKCQYKNNGDKK